MIEEKTISETVKRIFEEIEFTAEPAGLYDPLRYMISIGGKRIRPKLCLTAYSLFKEELCPEVLEPAADEELTPRMRLARATGAGHVGLHLRDEIDDVARTKKKREITILHRTERMLPRLLVTPRK